MNFDDVQQQEIEALKAIYGTDFVENVTKENGTPSYVLIAISNCVF